MKTAKLLTVLFLLLAPATIGQAAEPDLAAIGESTSWRVTNRRASLTRENDAPVAHLDARSGDGVAWFVGEEFTTGIIEVELRGRNQPGASFVGLAFSGADDTTFEAVYVRPFNFRSDDPARRAHSVQYISMPEHDWSKLRREHPGAYESALTPAPEPEAWLHLRLEVDEKTVRAFVNEASTPCLVVTRLAGHSSGHVGLWVGNGSAGDFAALQVAPSGSP